MNVHQAYNLWASQYDTNDNKTRDLEAKGLKEVLNPYSFTNGLEVGCGTGKNTQWLIQKVGSITAVDLSEEMISLAKNKVSSGRVKFVQFDITKPWTFIDRFYDLITFSLVLEHIKNINAVFEACSKCLAPGGMIYIGELHPFKQYTGSKAKFETSEGTQIVECYTHHLSDFFQLAKKYRLQLVDMREYFDQDNQVEIPRIIAMLLKNPA